MEVIMELKIIFIYCFCDDLLRSANIKTDAQSKMNNAEIMTVAITAALFYGGNISLARQVLKWNNHIRCMLSESRLNRRLHSLDFDIWKIAFHCISQIFHKKNDSLEYLVDSMPVEVCANYRSYRCKILKGKQYIGFCKAKKKYYYGFKLHMITTANGQPVEFIITPASQADITAFKSMDIELRAGSRIFGDKAYTDYKFEDYLLEIENIVCLPERKSNAKKQNSNCLEFIRSKLRKRIETSFSELTRLLPRKIDAVTANGFLLKLVIFVFSFALQKLL
jgi:hypothetical protein